jgi:hypothetical protein
MMVLGFAGVGFMAYRRKQGEHHSPRLIGKQFNFEEPPSGGFFF